MVLHSFFLTPHPKLVLYPHLSSGKGSHLPFSLAHSSLWTMGRGVGSSSRRKCCRKPMNPKILPCLAVVMGTCKPSMQLRTGGASAWPPLSHCTQSVLCPFHFTHMFCTLWRGVSPCLYPLTCQQNCSCGRTQQRFQTLLNACVGSWGFTV